MRLRFASVVVLLALAGCDKGPPDPRIALCVSATRQAATSPGSVRMLHFEATPKDVARAKEVSSKAVMDFEAMNSYDAKLRGTAVCAFAPHPVPERKGAFLLTSAVIGKIPLGDQQIAEANALDGSSRSVVEAITAAEMWRAEKDEAGSDGK